jgi:hypothetical protein
MATLDSLADRLDAATAAILALQPSVEAADPWELAELYGAEAEASWGPREVLAHVEEMLPFWLGEAERVLDGGADARVPIGRVATDPLRTGVIGRDRSLPWRELFSRVASDGARMAARMRDLTAEEAGRIGVHPRLGEMTVGGLFERFAVSHVEEHVAQLREILDAPGI